MKARLFQLCANADDIQINGYSMTEVLLDKAFGQDLPMLACLRCDDVHYHFEDQEVEVTDGIVEVCDFPNPEDPTDEVTQYSIEFRMLVPISEGDLP